MDLLIAQLKKSKVDAKEKFLIQRELNKQQKEDKKNLICETSSSSENTDGEILKHYGLVPHLDVFLNPSFWNIYGSELACEVVVIRNSDGNYSVTPNGVLLVNSLPCWWNLLKNEGVANSNTVFAKYVRLMGVFFVGAGYFTLQALNVYYGDFNYDVTNYVYLMDKTMSSIHEYLCSKGIESKFATFIVIAIALATNELDEDQRSVTLAAVEDAFKVPLWIYQPMQFERYLEDMPVVIEFKKSLYENDFPQLGESSSMPVNVSYTKEMKEGLLEGEFKQVLVKDKGGKFVSNNHGVEYREYDKISSYVYGQMNQFNLGDVIYSQWDSKCAGLVITPIVSSNVYAIKTLKDGSLVYGWTPMLRALLEMFLNGTIKIEVEYIEIDGNKTFKIDYDFIKRHGQYVFSFSDMRMLLSLANKYYAGIILHSFNCVTIFRIKHFNNAKLNFKKFKMSDNLTFFCKNGVMIITDLAFSAVAHRGVCSIFKARPVVATVVAEKDVLREFTTNMFIINDGLRSREGEIDVNLDKRYIKNNLYLSDVDENKGVLSHGLSHMLRSIVYDSNIGKDFEGNKELKLKTVIGEIYTFCGNRDKNGYWYEFIILDAILNTKKIETNILKKNSTYVQSFMLVYEYDKVIGTILNIVEDQDDNFVLQTIFTGGCIALVSNSILSNVTITTTGCQYLENPKIANLGYTNGEELILLLKDDYEKFIKRINFLLSRFVYLGCSSYQQHFMHHGIHMVRDRIFQTTTLSNLELGKILCPTVFQTLCEKNPNSRSNAVKPLKHSDPLRSMYNEYVADFSRKCQSILSLVGAKNIFKTYLNSPFGYRCTICNIKYSIDAYEISQNCCKKKGHVMQTNGFVQY